MKHDKTEKKMPVPALSRLSEKIGLPLDILRGVPYIQLYGGRSLIIEGNLRIDCYDENALSVRCGKNILLIAGRGLRVTLLDGEALAVSGTITSVSIDA